MNNANLTRRNFLKGSAAAAGAAAVAVTGFSQLFGYEQVFAQGKGDDIQTIVNLASTAEQLAVTHYEPMVRFVQGSKSHGDRPFLEC